MKDRPHRWRDLVRKAQKSPRTGLVYLNRYEGLSPPDLEAIIAYGSDRFDRISDAAAKQVAPGLQDSFLVLDPSSLIIQRTMMPDEARDATLRSAAPMV